MGLGKTAVTRRSLLGGIAGASLVSGTGIAAPARSRPNILWIVSEDNNPFIRAYGDQLARTPTIDALAASGVLFTRTYSNAPVCAPSRFGILTGVYPESCAPANQMRAVAKLPKDFKPYPQLMREAGYFCTNNAKTDYNCDVDPAAIWDVQGVDAHWRKRKDARPFMAVFNLDTTHESKIFSTTTGAVTPEMVTLPAFLPDRPEIRQDYASYYNLMEKMDWQVGKLLADLKADGLDQDTIVFYYSDNGGVLGRSKRYCYEDGLRCAMVVHAPPKWQHLLPAEPGKRFDPPVSFIDLAPTVLALAGVRQPAQMKGQPLLGSRSRATRRFVFGMRNRMDERIDFIRTVTDGRWRYIRNYMPHRPWGQHQAFEWQARGYQAWQAEHLAGRLNPVQNRFFETKPFEELYDLQADPEEVRNLAADPSRAKVLDTLRRALDRHMIEINDNGFLPESMQGEGYFESRDPSVYPLHRIMALAAVAARGGSGDVPQLLSALRSPLAVERYWAATGLLIRGKNAAPAASALRAAMLQDPSPLVRVVAAEASAGLGQGAEAVGVLASLVDSGDVWPVRLHALNALTFLDKDLSAAARPAVDRAAQDTKEYVRNAGRYLQAVLEGTFTPASQIFDAEFIAKRAH